MKDCTTCKYGFVDEQLGFPMCHHPSRFSEDCVDFNMHEEKEEPEKATGIEEKKLPDGLEEAAEKYRRNSCNAAMKPNVDGPTPEYGGSIKGAFIAGAEWQKKRDDLETADLLAIAHLQGMEQQKAKMMEGAVEIEVKEDAGGYPIVPLDAIELYDYENDKPLAKAGNKVRIIVIKED